MAVAGRAKRFQLLKAGKPILRIDTDKTMTADQLRGLFAPKKMTKKETKP